jgi:hypothetical protein
VLHPSSGLKSSKYLHIPEDSNLHSHRRENLTRLKKQPNHKEPIWKLCTEDGTYLSVPVDTNNDRRMEKWGELTTS